jgi:UDP-2-acetamido-2,6-beta-L-arabino-hexul-4-ose reductase
MKKIGITGKSGFIGSHLSNNLYLYKEKYELVKFEDDYFNKENLLNDFVKKCDIIIHLAALNRHDNPDEIYKTNILLVQKLINALEYTQSKPQLIFSSSTQEEIDNPYGISKREGRLLLKNWAEKSGGRFTGLIIPNVFGPFGNPFYNSFISTFAYQLIRNLEPKIDIDAEIGLIYVDELVSIIIQIIDNDFPKESAIKLEETSRYKVSEVLSLLNNFKHEYLQYGIIPAIDSEFKINLFNTFRSYIDLKNYYPFQYKLNKDERGIFIETMKLRSGGQVSYSTTKPNITRGNHFHKRKIERFTVIKGEAIIKVRKINTQEILEFKLSGDEPSFIDIPIWYAHNITNVGDNELITLFWINEFFIPENPDTFYEEV